MPLGIVSNTSVRFQTCDAFPILQSHANVHVQTFVTSKQAAARFRNMSDAHTHEDKTEVQLQP